MIWMLTAIPADTGMPAAGAARGAMAPMSRAATSAPVPVISILLAVSCATAFIPWLARVDPACDRSGPCTLSGLSSRLTRTGGCLCSIDPAVPTGTAGPGKMLTT